MKKLSLLVFILFFAVTAYSAYLKNVPVDLKQKTEGLVNLTNAGTWRQPVDEYIPIGPVKVRVKLPEDVHGRNVQLLVSDQKISGKVEKGWVQFTVSSILDHEVVVIT